MIYIGSTIHIPLSRRIHKPTSITNTALRQRYLEILVKLLITSPPTRAFYPVALEILECKPHCEGRTKTHYQPTIEGF